MVIDYIHAAMRRATYELMPDGEGFFARIPGCQGVWANQDTLEACRDELQSVLEDWILIKLRHDDADFTVFDGLDLNPPPASSADSVAHVDAPVVGVA